ncbi:MAG: hypothetical protein R3F17_05580 [Planctomycetota bacterium]
MRGVQVSEHTVTEMTTGIDIIQQQIHRRPARTSAFAKKTQPRGHTIECRINAEDPRATSSRLRG